MITVSDILLKYNLTETQLASMLGMSLKQINRLKTGKSKPGRKAIKRIAEVFPEIDVRELI